MVAFGCNRSTAGSSGSTSGLLSSSATITGSSVSVPGWYNPIETEVNRFPTPGASGGLNGLVCYDGHSYRIGAATAAAKLGASDSMIKVLGRWEILGIHTLYTDALETAGADVGFVVWW